MRRKVLGWGVIGVGLVVTLLALPNIASATPIRTWHPPYPCPGTCAFNVTGNWSKLEAHSRLGGAHNDSFSEVNGTGSFRDSAYFVYSPTVPRGSSIHDNIRNESGFSVSFNPSVNRSGRLNFTWTWNVTYNASLSSLITTAAGVYSTLNIWFYFCASPGYYIVNSNCSSHYLVRWGSSQTSHPNGTFSGNGTNVRVTLKEREFMTPGIWSIACYLRIDYRGHVTAPKLLGPGSYIYWSSNVTAALESIKVST